MSCIHSMVCQESVVTERIAWKLHEIHLMCPSDQTHQRHSYVYYIARNFQTWESPPWEDRGMSQHTLGAVFTTELHVDYGCNIAYFQVGREWSCNFISGCWFARIGIWVVLVCSMKMKGLISLPHATPLFLFILAIPPLTTPYSIMLRRTTAQHNCTTERYTDPHYITPHHTLLYSISELLVALYFITVRCSRVH